MFKLVLDEIFDCFKLWSFKLIHIGVISTYSDSFKLVLDAMFVCSTCQGHMSMLVKGLSCLNCIDYYLVLYRKIMWIVGHNAHKMILICMGQKSYNYGKKLSVVSHEVGVTELPERRSTYSMECLTWHKWPFQTRIEKRRAKSLRWLELGL